MKMNIMTMTRKIMLKIITNMIMAMNTIDIEIPCKGLIKYEYHDYYNDICYNISFSINCNIKKYKIKKNQKSIIAKDLLNYYDYVID